VDIQAMQAERDRLDEQIKTAKADARRAEREAAQAKRKAEAEEHYARMYDEIGQPLAGLNDKQHAIVYSLAYDQGHASGFGEVETYYGEFAEMARKLIEAN
jgi:hypothetical protein